MERARDHQYPLVDTHAHLTYDSFTDVPDVIERARAGGMVRILTVALDFPSCRSAQALAETYPEIYATAGIHPNGVRADDDFELLRSLARAPRVVAIGETGLDYYRDRTDPALQRGSLRQHLEIATHLDLPIIIHNREADADVVEALTAFSGRARGILHCFSSDAAMAHKVLDLGFYISFAGNLTYPSAGALRAVARDIPVDQLLVETDAPFLSPVPRRGKRNEPLNVQFTLRTLADVRGMDVHKLAHQIAANAQRLLRW